MQKIGDTSKHHFADLLNSAAERERTVSVERLVKAAVNREKWVMRGNREEEEADEVDGEELGPDAATRVLKKTIGNPEIAGSAVSITVKNEIAEITTSWFPWFQILFV